MFDIRIEARCVFCFQIGLQYVRVVARLINTPTGSSLKSARLLTTEYIHSYIVLVNTRCTGHYYTRPLQWSLEMTYVPVTCHVIMSIAHC